MNENRLHGVIDMHIHSAPDVRERRLDDLQIMEAAIERGIQAVVIKSHMVPTMDRATLVNRIAGEKYGDVPFTMYGGITLNRSVGGLNPWAAEAACKLGAKVIWLPTMSAENHIQKGGKGPAVKVTEDGKIDEALKDIFQVAKDFEVVLATGHISDKECFVVAEAARAFGVRKLVVTHPEFWVVGMSLEDQIKIVRDYDVLLERVYAQPIGGGKYKKNLADNVEAVKAIGAAHLVVSTDGGQMQNPPWFETITEYVDTLYEAGFSAGDIRQMTHTNPARLLGIE